MLKALEKIQELLKEHFIKGDHIQINITVYTVTITYEYGSWESLENNQIGKVLDKLLTNLRFENYIRKYTKLTVGKKLIVSLEIDPLG